jgi:hypothetical protein
MFELTLLLPSSAVSVLSAAVCLLELSVKVTEKLGRVEHGTHSLLAWHRN